MMTEYTLTLLPVCLSVSTNLTVLHLNQNREDATHLQECRDLVFGVILRVVLSILRDMRCNASTDLTHVDIHHSSLFLGGFMSRERSLPRPQ